MVKANGVDIHATGAPDTPVEVVADLLAKALEADDIQEVKRLVKQSYDVVGGLDPYLDQISSPPSKASAHCFCTRRAQTMFIPRDL